MNSQDGWQGRNATRPGRRALMPEDKENGAGNQSSESEERLRKRLRRLKRRMRNEDRGWRAGAIAALVLIAVAILVRARERLIGTLRLECLDWIIVGCGEYGVMKCTSD